MIIADFKKDYGPLTMKKCESMILEIKTQED